MINSIRFKEDCFAFSDNSYVKDKDGKTVIRHLVCKALKRDNCENCSFYKSKSTYNNKEIEKCVSLYSAGKIVNDYVDLYKGKNK